MQQMTGCKIASPKYFMTKEHKSQHDSLLNSSHSQYKLLLFWLPVCLGIVTQWHSITFGM